MIHSSLNMEPRTNTQVEDLDQFNTRSRDTEKEAEMDQQKVLAVFLFFFLFWTSASLASDTLVKRPRDAMNGSVTIEPRKRNADTPCDPATEAALSGLTLLAPGESVCFDSPLFPNDYTNSYNGEWSFRATRSESEIRMRCDAFDVEYSSTCYYDNLTVSHADGQARYCNSNRPPTELDTNGDWLDISFETDSSVRYQGFKCWVSASEERPADTPCDPATEAALFKLTFLLPGEKLCFNSPLFPNDYPNNHYGNWSFRATHSESEIKMRCDAFNVEAFGNCAFDYLSVSHADGQASYCNSNLLPTKLDTTGDWLDISFSTDISVNSYGFKCWVSASEVPTTSTISTTTRDPNKIACECGIPNPTRIVGGDSSPVNHYPWLVGLSEMGGSDMPFCGGSIFNDEWIITAAHCVDGQNEGSMEVLLNMWNWNNDSTGVIRRNIDKIVMHPNYNSGTLKNDIALLRLTNKVSFTRFPGIKPICLPSVTANFVGQDAVTTGWGVTSQGGSQPFTVREVTVPIISRSTCRSVYGSSVTNNMICAGLAAGGKDSCQGDSGGPLTVPDASGKHYLAGIVSWGSGCAQPGLYGVYTDVPNYIVWITNFGFTGKYCQN